MGVLIDAHREEMINKASQLLYITGLKVDVPLLSLSAALCSQDCHCHSCQECAPKALWVVM